MPKGIRSVHPEGVDDADALVLALEALSLKNKRLVKATMHDAPADPKIKICSWKMDEFKYAVHPSPFPTLARGLFTRKIDGDGDHADGLAEGASMEGRKGHDRHIIIARGYDKFFNIGEVPWNSWPSIEKYTNGPYHLTLKSNGCIIFIAALSSTELVVTSKHSLGHPLSEGTTTHAMMGDRWLHKHLKGAGKNPQDLASRLWKENITAVAELCDDSFEEHVLSYPPEISGLHFHGLNKNTAAFTTYPPSDVDAFAEEFGFIKTEHMALDTACDVRKFTDNVGETGEWNGKAVEGFVVRCKVADRSSDSADASPAPTPSDNKKQRGDGSKSSAIMHPPYPPGSDYFFKVKFDEPYLMYRAWREITKAVLNAKAKGLRPITVPRSKLARTENRLYREWVEREIDAHPEDFTEFNKGKGIIETRERFLRWFNTKEGQKRLAVVGSADDDTTTARVEVAVVDAAEGEGREKLRAERDSRTGKLVIVPIAVPGCGKTTVAVALKYLFPSFGHTQSDDVRAKKTAPTFQKNITELLKTRNVVIADRNNHLVQHRQGVRVAADAAIPKTAGSPTFPIRLVALNWSITNLPFSTVHRICSTRVVARGENHQSLRPSPKVSHEDVIWQFISSSEELGEGEVDGIIEMDVAAESLENAVSIAVDGLIPILSKWVEPPSGEQGWQRPTAEQIKVACNAARGCKVTVKKDDGGHGKTSAIRYFAFLPEVDIVQVVENLLQSFSNVEPNSSGVDLRSFWTSLKSSNRITRRPHITIAHKQDLPAQQQVWDSCVALDAIKAWPALFEFRLGTIVCDGKVMSIAVDDLRLLPRSNEEANQEAVRSIGVNIEESQMAAATKAAEKLLQDIPEALKARLHITVGTINEDIKQSEGGKIVQRWKAGAEGIISVPIVEKFVVIGRVRGLTG